jgi:hypothetical protein
VVKLIMLTGCFPRCALVSAVTWKNPPNEEHGMTFPIRNEPIVQARHSDLARMQFFE